MHADANRFERSRALHLPYYVPNGQFANTSGSANRSLLAFMSASKNTIFADETTYTYLPSDSRAVRSQRGDDVRAERCLRVGRD